MTAIEPNEVKLDCEVCMKEIPVSEDQSEEARDYIMHYCGIECYDRWRKSGNTTN